MDPIVEEFTITLKYQVTVNTETGEMTTKCIKRTVDKSNFEVSEAAARKTAKKTKKEESSSPQLILEDNKYYLNSAAIELMGVTPDDKLDITAGGEITTQETVAQVEFTATNKFGVVRTYTVNVEFTK